MAHPYTPTIIYEDNHLLCVAKRPGEIVQGDKTGDEPMSEALKGWLKVKYSKPGNVYLGVIHRLDRRVVGQDEAVRAVSDAIRRSRSGLADPNKPYGYLLPTL